jgi:hypothetical protein
MTYPVQPPEPPAIVYHVPSQNAPVPALGFDADVAIARNESPVEASIEIVEDLPGVSRSETPETEIAPEIEGVQLEPKPLETPTVEAVGDTEAIVPESLPESEETVLEIAPETEVGVGQPEPLETSNSEGVRNAEGIHPTESLPEPETIEISNPISEPTLDTTSLSPPPSPQVVQPSLPELEPESLLPEVAAQPSLPDKRPSSDAVPESAAEIDRDSATLILTSEPQTPNPKTQTPNPPTTEIRQVGTLPQFSRDSHLLNAQTLPTPTFDWAVMPSDPTPDASFRLPSQLIPPPVDGVALQPSPRVNPPIEVTADLQQLEEERRLFTAEGNVVLRYQGTVIDADWLQVNLRSRQGIGEGNVALTQINRVLRGDRFRYNFAQDSGTIYGVRGDVNTATTPNPAQTLPSDVSAGGQPRLLSDRLLAAQPVEVTPGLGGFVGTVGAGRGNNPSATTGTLSRLRFEADEVNFYPRGWEGRGVRITNDPFGPEIEVRADSATLTRLSPLQDELVLSNPRLVFDDGFALPLLRRRYRIDRRERDPALIQFGFDRRDRGGFYVFRDFEVLSRQGLRLTLTPQYYVQRGFDRRNPISLREFGLVTKVEADFTPNTSLTAIASFTNLDPETFDPDGNPFDDDDGDLRASVRLAQNIPTRLGLHTLTTEYSYRDRLFNGSLGFRTVHQTAGLIFTSPNILLGKSGVNLSYQAGYNWVEANTDRLDLLEPIRDSNRINMGRFQASFALNKGIFLWRGEPLPATPTEGLRFSPIPVVPFVQVFFGVRGIGSFYTRSDPALGLTGTVGLQGQFGHFAKKFLDYSAFSISYSGTLREGESPFLFDRIADRSILGLSFTQQLYGPLRVGIATAINLEEGEAFSTDYTLEYSRRSYGLILRFNPQRELGSFTLRISDFNWQGGTEPFTPIDGGVRRD